MVDKYIVIMKKCGICEEVKPLDEFYKHSKGSQGRQSRCKACNKIVGRKYRKPHHVMRSKLGLSDADIQKLYDRSEGLCENPSCRAPAGNRALHLDHDHKTGKPRGLLCHGCNTALGALKDNHEIILGLSQYLAQSKPLE